MEKERENKWEREIRFVARRYREGALDPGRAWERFAAARGIRIKTRNSSTARTLQTGRR